MKKIFLVMMMTLIGAFVLTSIVMAKDSGTFCWNLQPFDDNLEVATETQAGHYEAYGVLRCWPGPNGCIFAQVGAPGPYSVAVDGAATWDPVFGDFDFELFFSDIIDTPIMGSFHAKILPDLTGPWMVYDLFLPAGPFIAGGLMPIPCPIP
jgi:hypothetical protein